MLPADSASHPSSHAARSITLLGNVVELTLHSLDDDTVVKSILDSVKDKTMGAISLFIGTTRDNFQEKSVTRLEYQAYSSLAIKTLASIADSACTTPNLDIRASSAPSNIIALNPQEGIIPHQRQIKCAIVHRLGDVPVGETSIVIAVSTPHRREAFEACEWILEEVKKRAQIWKREWYAGGDGDVIVARDGEEGGELETSLRDPPPEPLWKANFTPKAVE